MKKELTSIQISKEFKEIIRLRKKESETYEEYFKRLVDEIPSIDMSIDTSIDNNKEIPFEKVKFGDGLYYSVEKSMAQKFKEIDVPEFSKIVESPQTDFIEGTPTLTYSDDPIKRNFCKEHKLPATYDSSLKKWICNKCSEELILAQ